MNTIHTPNDHHVTITVIIAYTITTATPNVTPMTQDLTIDLTTTDRTPDRTGADIKNTDNTVRITPTTPGKDHAGETKRNKTYQPIDNN